VATVTALVTSWSSGQAVITLTADLAGSSGDLALTALSAKGGSSSSLSFTVTESGALLAGGNGTDAYEYKLGYLANGNIASSSDWYAGSWVYSYDTLNRVTSSLAGSPLLLVNGTKFTDQCWTYDDFGNRTGEIDQNANCPGNLSNSPNYSTWATYNSASGNNQVTGSNVVASGLVYDLAGDVVNDGVNQYAYDAEGRLCAVETIAAGSGPATQYVYDAEGQRVAKGTLTLWPASGSACSAPTAANGFTPTNLYLRGSAGNQDVELDGQGNWIHDNVFAEGGLSATFWNTGTAAAPVAKLSYEYNNWLGSKRLQTDASGNLQQYWVTDPYGDYLSAYPSGSGLGATEHQFTGKERDAESGNDYFGARYYASSMGRFMSPDWAAKEEPVPYATFDDPQSLNLYSYVRNNPLSRVDADGHCPDACVIEGPSALVVGLAVGGTALYVGARTYLNTPSGQRSAETFTNAVSNSFSSSVSSIKSTVSGWFSKKSAPAPTTGTGQNNPTGPAQPKSNPWTGTPGSTSTTTQPDGTPKQVREYGPDGYPKTDVDYGHDHGQGDPHAHDTGRPTDGSPPTAADRAPGRPVQPTDPKPQPPPKQQP